MRKLDMKRLKKLDIKRLHEKNGHHEHGGIGETLETIFTVIGGLILLGAHYLNIRSIRRSA